MPATQKELYPASLRLLQRHLSRSHISSLTPDLATEGFKTNHYFASRQMLYHGHRNISVNDVGLTLAAKNRTDSFMLRLTLVKIVALSVENILI